MIQGFWSGADVSFLDEIENKGGKFFDESQEDDCLAILQRYGMNAIRLRIWNNPKDGYCSLDNTLRMAKRLKNLGFVLGIDFHYSDWWADPGKQYKPKAWENLPFDALVQSVYDFTYEVLDRLRQQGTPANFVQVGNEVTYGMLWEDGRLPGPNEDDDAEAWKRFSRLMSSGVRAARDCQGQDVNVLLHIDRGGDNAGARFFLDHVLSEGVEFDSIGLSYYPWWHGSMQEFESNLHDLASRYQKDLVLVETAYPWTEVHPENALTTVDASAAQQKVFLETVMDIVQRVPGGLGKGVFYWEPDAIPVGESPAGWSKMSLFDSEGRVLPGVEAFNTSERHQ